MVRFKVEWTEEIWNRVFIEAESADEAREKFWNGEFDSDSVNMTGTEIQDGIDVWGEVE